MIQTIKIIIIVELASYTPRQYKNDDKNDAKMSLFGLMERGYLLLLFHDCFIACVCSNMANTYRWISKATNQKQDKMFIFLASDGD